MHGLLLQLNHSENPITWFRLLLGTPEEPHVTDLSLEQADDKGSAAWQLLDGLDQVLQSLLESNRVYLPQDPPRLDGD